jgi:phosphoglycolate phosphatase
MKPYDLLIFDWDGTLADSAGEIVANMQRAISALELPPRADHQIAEMIGLGFADGLKQIYPEIDTPKLMALLHEYRQRTPNSAYAAALFAGVAETLSHLRDHGYLLAIATGKPRAALQRSLAAHPQLQPHFSLTRCADETANKPDPLMLREILAETGIAAGRALMIGDTEYDAAMATAIGMPTLGVACGVHDAGRQRRAGALAVVESVRAVPAWLAARSSP